MQCKPVAVFAVVMIFQFVIGGCGSSQSTSNAVKFVSTVPASGVLLCQGKPLAFHQINVVLDKDRGGSGISDEEGKFSLGTNRPGDGVPPGTHKVSVVYVGNPKDDPAKRGLGNVSAPPPKPSIKIAEKYRRAETSGLTIEVPASGSKTLEINLN